MFKLFIKSIISTLMACIIWLPLFMLIAIFIAYIFLPLHYFDILSQNVINSLVVGISLVISCVLSFWLSIKFIDLLNIGE